MSLTLLVPDLLPPSDAPAAVRSARLPALEKWLARADLVRASARGSVAWLASACGLPEAAPYAAVALAGEDASREGTWMRADPVHLRINRDLVALYDASMLAIAPDEASALAEALRPLFAPDGLELVCAAPGRWYLRAPPDSVPETTPLEAAIGRDIFGLLPRGGSLNWRSLMTEAQMVMSQHEVNARREAAGAPAINAIWFWGQGALPASLAVPFDRIAALEPFARGLARASGATPTPPPASLAALAPAGKDTLIVLEDLVGAFRRGDAQAWLAAARALDERWFAGLGDAARRWGGARLVLPAENDTVVATLSSTARWRLLRKRHPLAHHA